MIIVGSNFAMTAPNKFVKSPNSQSTMNVTDRPSPDLSW
jgi:hypothetical protein